MRDMDPAAVQVLALGARPANHGGAGFRAYLDPASHPLCLVSW
ncbi:hypothetical protein GCM10023166_25930 [Paeniglutamicibacter cryotolerans]